MNVGLYMAAHGMRSIEDRQAVIANNIANAATPGFRRQEGIVEGFYHLLLGETGTVQRYDVRDAPGGGLKLTETFSDVRGGPVVATGRSLDAALEGPGFFGVETPFGERFMRHGSLSRNSAGALQTPDGFNVQSVGGGPLVLGEGRIMFSPDGTVLVNGQPAGQLRLVEFDDPHMLTREGRNLYRASVEALEQSAPAENTRVIGGSIEQSNVQVGAEVMKLRLGARAYAANQRVVNAIDETISMVIREVGTPR